MTYLNDTITDDINLNALVAVLRGYGRIPFSQLISDLVSLGVNGVVLDEVFTVDTDHDLEIWNQGGYGELVILGYDGPQPATVGAEEWISTLLHIKFEDS